MNQEPEHIEGRLWRFVFAVGFLWMDRFMIRMLPLSLVALLAMLIHHPLGESTALIAAVMPIAGLWAIADLARGIELDHQYKDHTLRDSFDEWREDHETS